jgi:hypothetical protein
MLMEQKAKTVGKQSHQSTIELNGHRYNAHTGNLIEGISTPAQLEGNNTVLAPAKVRHSIERNKTTSHQIHRAPEHSHTLMRSAVRKPSVVTSGKTVAMDVVQMPGQATATAFHTPSPERLNRAHAVRQNNLINRFGGEVREAALSAAPQAAGSISMAHASEHAKSVASEHHLTQSKKNVLLDKGLHAATSHQKTRTKKPRLHHRVGQRLGLSARAASIATGSMALLLFGAFFAYQNVPNIAVRYAAAKSGVHASLPSYQPAGFAVNNHVNYSPGEVTIAYKANADNRTYSITQQNTNWNSDALKEHLAASNGNTPQSFPDNGRTIYLHGTSEADWVAGGVWYSITGDSSLNTDQLIKIATSI